MSRDENPAPAFTDKLGRAWQVPAEYDLFHRIKAATGVDLLDLASTQKSLEQLRDPYTLVAVLEAATEPEALARGVSKEQFRAGIDGDTLRRGSDALVDAAVFFSPLPSQTILRTIVRTARETEERMQAATLARLDQLEQATRTALENLAPLSASSTSSPASSASTPDDGASGRSPGRRGRSSRRTGSTLASS